MTCPRCNSPRIIPFRHHPPPASKRDHDVLIKAGHDHWNECAVTGTMCLRCRVVTGARETKQT